MMMQIEFFFQAEDGIRYGHVTGVQTCALPIYLLLLDVTTLGLTGQEAEEVLDAIGITTNKNTIPFDKKGAAVTSGIRIGTAAITTRGFTEEDMIEIADIMTMTLKQPDDRSEEHTSELQSRGHLVCRLLLEKKNDD